MKHLSKHNKIIAGGFTIIETLVAITLILVAVSATLGAAQLGLQTSLYARDQITAYYLGEEAIEQIRNLRDSNYVATSSCSWLSNGDDPEAPCQSIPSACIRVASTTATPLACGIDVVSNPGTFSMALCSSEPQGSCKLLLDPDSGYNYTSGLSTHFTRSIDVSMINNYEAMVTANVSWSSGPFSTQSVTLREDLFDWNQN